MDVQRNISLKGQNTFGFDVSAHYFIRVRKRPELIDFIKKFLPDLPKPLLVLGGGSNIVFTGDFEGTIIRLMNKGITVVGETDNYILVKAEAAESWDEFVNYCISQDWGGLENLILIPGTVGSSPIQNIGAYGAEVKDCLHSLEAMDIENAEIREFTNEDCQFGYRTSVFKNELKGRYIVLSVTFKLSLAHNHNVSYQSIKSELDAMDVSVVGINEVAEAVTRIRKRKIPDPDKLGNAGSFFKNPIVTAFEFYRLKNLFPTIVNYNQFDGTFKLSAGWLIEQCGWKGYRRGNAGVHTDHALILVNYGKAKGKDIINLANDINKSVQDKFGITLEPEVTII